MDGRWGQAVRGDGQWSSPQLAQFGAYKVAHEAARAAWKGVEAALTHIREFRQAKLWINTLVCINTLGERC
eukprot:SAG11_NODE_8197_length_1048_cov_1.362487_2_plen_71_part_00